MQNTSISPNFIYVSELLRTWETAVLLFLSLLNTFLTLYISPFLRETGLYPFPSDNPGELKEQVKEFVRFIAFLRELKKSNINGISDLIPEKFSIILKHFGGNFTHEHIASIGNSEGIELSISRDGGIQIECNFGSNDTTQTPNTTMQTILDKIKVDSTSGYVPYKDVSSESALLFPKASGVENIGTMDTPSTPPGSLAGFVDWYKSLQEKPHVTDIVYFVSHSGTMNKFIKQVEELNSSPSQQFETAYEEAIKTNTWSLFFKTDEQYVFKGFRHAYSCDNRSMDKGPQTFLKRTSKEGEYTNLSLWGILSTLKFSNEKVQSLITDREITSPTGLKICRGMDKELDQYHDSSFDSVNMLCGEQRDRMPIGNFSLSLGHCGTSGGIIPTLDKDCIRIITDPKGKKVVLYLDKKTNVIQARFFESAETSTSYSSFNSLPSQLDSSLNKIIKWLVPNVIPNTDTTLKLKNELMESIKLFINSDEAIKPRWEIAFNTLYTGFVDQLQQQRQQQKERWRNKFDMPVKNTAAFEKPNILDETKCIKITANKDTDEFTLDLVNCARPNMEQEHVSSSTFALLFLDKNEHKIECKLFENNTIGINFSFDNEQYLGTYLVNILTGLGVIDKEKQKSLKLKLIESIKIFIESNAEIDPKWKELLTPLYQSYIDKKAEKAEKAEAEAGVGVGVEITPAFDNLSIQREGMVTAGGTNKRTRRHRKHKVMKKYTRKHKKYNPRRKSRRIQKRKQTHKRKLGKSRKSRKSRK